MRNRRLVAVILDTTRPYQRKIIRGVAAYARDAASWSLYVEEDRLDKLPNLRTWHGHGVILSFVERKDAEAVRDLSIPVVGVEGGYGWYDPASHIPYFATDDNAIGRMAAEHLMGQGFSRLAYCGMPRNRLNVWSEKRARAFKQRASEAGLPCSMYRGRHLSVRHWNELQRDLADWLRSLEKPVGIMAANDARARHLLEACRTIGAHVPNEVAVIGVDNDELMCELTEPPLTSIEQGARAVGYRAAKLLDRMMSGKKPLADRQLRRSRGGGVPPIHRLPGHRRPGRGGGGAVHSPTCLRTYFHGRPAGGDRRIAIDLGGAIQQDHGPNRPRRDPRRHAQPRRNV